MQYEKSCGAVIYKMIGDIREYLLIFNKKGDALGHWGFAKGHVENDETETQTALREILEETGLDADLIDGFRYVSTYNPKPDVCKDAVYFIAHPNNDDISLQAEEVANFKWCNFEDALRILTYDQDLLIKADEFLSNI